ncbi:MAG: alpha-2-macroglobulin family protein, partial [Planctomycetota bacterium]
MRVERHTGTVKLYGVDLTEQHVPNVFLSAYTTQRGKVHSDSVEVLVPPIEQFLDVVLEPTEESYLPGAAGKFTLVAKDHAGQPVQGEFSVAVADAALAAIQGDYAKDPRKVYYGEKRAQKITTALSLQLRQLVNLQEGEEANLKDELAFASDSPFDSAAFNDSMGISGGAGGFMLESSSAVMGKKSRSRGMPASAARASLRQSEDMELAEAAPVGNWDQGDASGGSAGSGEIRVRSDFRETAVWAPRVLTDAEGRAEIEFEFPDNLTRWSATAIGTTNASRFGIGRSTTKTSQPLTVRLQAPRFFVKKDICLISGLIRNASTESMYVTPSLDIDDALSMGQMRGRQFNHGARGGRLPVEIAPGGEERVDWWVYVKGEDSTKIRVTAASADYSDAEERTYPVESHGIETLAAITGRLESGEQGDGADALQLSLDLPAE